MFTTKNLIILIGKQSLIAIVVAALSFFAILFLSRQIEQVSNAIAQNNQLSEKLEKRTELFSVLARNIAMVGTNDAIIEESFIPADNILPFILTLENTALKNSATESFHFDTPAPASETAPFPLSVIGYQNTLALDISSFRNYLRDFEKLPYFTRIDNLSFTASGASGWEKGGTASYRAVLYTKTAN